jgi:hypothetical protein
MRNSTTSALATSALLLAASPSAMACMHMSTREVVLIALMGALFAGVPYMLLTAPLLIFMRRGLFDSLRGLFAGFIKAYFIGAFGLMVGVCVAGLLGELVRAITHARMPEEVTVVIALTTPLLFEAAWISRRWTKRAALREE